MTERLELELSAEDRDLLRAAIAGARGAEAAEIQRLGGRLVTGYGSDVARASMAADLEQHRRRLGVLDRLLGALSAGSESRGS